MSSALAADNAVFVERETKIEHAALNGGAEVLAGQVAGIDHDLAAAPSDPALLYLRALAHYAEACVARAERNNASVETQMNAAVEMLAQIKDPTWEGEALALQGFILNQLIGVKGFDSAEELGPKSAALLAQAGGRAPNSPRVQFFRGESLVTTPEAWGGDVVLGIKLLEQAAQSFDHQPKTALLHWGQAEGLVWLGIARQKSGDVAGARTAWERALAAEPEYGWVKYVLLPSLDKSTAANKK